MNKIFDIKRFFNYFMWDLKNVRNNFGLSFLILSSSLAILYVVMLLITIVFDFRSLAFFSVSNPSKIAVSILAMVALFVSFPQKQYGQLTDKKSGSAWLMIPASAFEKTMSILLTTCLVLPLCYALMVCAWDKILSFLPGYGDTVVPSILSAVGSLNNIVESDGLHIGINADFAAYLNWCEWILTFTLGAIFFRKSKTAKTILSVLGLLMVLSAFSALILQNIDFAGLDIDLDGKRIVNIMNVVVNLIYLAVFALLDLGIYLRIKTLKH